jgi:hypothetical protein
LILERYDKDRISPSKKCLKRGFKRVDYEWDEPQLVIDTMDPLTNQNELEYLKLHGSIDWWIRNRDNRIVMRESNYSLMGEMYSQRSMIYPAYDKRISKEPSASSQITPDS